jgi:hypothetical protein
MNKPTVAKSKASPFVLRICLNLLNPVADASLSPTLE